MSHSTLDTELRNTPIAPLEDETWGTQAFAQLFSITARAIRFYEDKKLLSPRREAGSRIFDVTDYGRMVMILRAKRLGFSLDDIRAVLEVTDGIVTDRDELLRRQESFKIVINNLRKRRADIDIVTQQMSELCDLIEEHAQNAEPPTQVLHLAEAYEHAFRKHLADDFNFDVASPKLATI